MTARLEMSDEAYAVLIEDVAGVKNIAYQVRGLVPNHIWSRLDYLATDLQSLMRDGVDVVKEDEYDEDHPDPEAMAARIDRVYDEERDRRGHINLEVGKIMTKFDGAISSLKGEEKA